MKQFLVKPNLVGDLTYANTTSGSLYGNMVCNWTRSGSTATFDIEVPPNTTAKVFIPAGNVTDVCEGGQPAARAEGVTYLEREEGYEVFSVASGKYRFTSSSIPSVH